MRKATGKPEAGDAGPEAVPADNPNPEVPVFDRATEDLPWPQNETLPADDEGNILPGNDPLDEDPNDNGDEEQFDPEDLRQRPDPAARASDQRQPHLSPTQFRAAQLRAALRRSRDLTLSNSQQ